MANVIAFVEDLLFRSRISEAARGMGGEVRFHRTIEELRRAVAADRPALALIDLDSTRLSSIEALEVLSGEPPIETIGFLSHVHTERKREAEKAGCKTILTRGALVRELPRLLGSSPTEKLP